MVVLVLKTEVGCDSAVPYVEEHYSPHLEHLLAADEFERCKEELEALIKASFPETACFSLNSGCGYFSLIATGLFVGYLVGKTTCSPSDKWCSNGMFGMLFGEFVAIVVFFVAFAQRKICLKDFIAKVPPKLAEFQQRHPGVTFQFIHIPELFGRTPNQYMIEIKPRSFGDAFWFTRDPYGSLLLRQCRQFASQEIRMDLYC